MLYYSGYNDYTVNLWDTLKCERITVLYGHENRVTSLKVREAAKKNSSTNGQAIKALEKPRNLRIG